MIKIIRATAPFFGVSVFLTPPQHFPAMEVLICILLFLYLHIIDHHFRARAGSCFIVV